MRQVSNYVRIAKNAYRTTSQGTETPHLERIRAISRLGRQAGHGDTKT